MIPTQKTKDRQLFFSVGAKAWPQCLVINRTECTNVCCSMEFLLLQKAPVTHIISLLIEVCSVLACIDLGEDLRHQLSVGTWCLAITISMIHSYTTTNPRTSSDGPPNCGANPPPSLLVDLSMTCGLSSCLEKLRQLQGKCPSIPPPSKVSGEEW